MTTISPDPKSPFWRVIEALERCGSRPKVRGNKAKAHCPAHRDRTPSLGITDCGDRTLLNCFAGCRFREVLKQLGLRQSDLLANPTNGKGARPRPVEEVVYQYLDLKDEKRFEKVRFRPKSFRMRRPDPTARRGYVWDLKSTEPILYRWPELVESRRVVVVEGEKAVDHLRSAGIAATCGPFGSTRWLPVFLEALWCAGCVEVVILPDHDGTGRRFADGLAAQCHGYRPDPAVFSDPDEPVGPDDLADPLLVPLVVRVVDLPGLRLHQDVVDWFKAGGTRERLMELIDASPDWSPEALEQARRARERAGNAERQRRWRERRKSNR